MHANEAALVINIVDAANLERNLYLTTQLAEMRVPLLVVLNMVDVAESKGMKVDAAALSRRLGCPVVPVVASDGRGIAELRTTIREAVQARRPASAEVGYDAGLEEAIAVLAPQLAEAAAAHAASPPRRPSRPKGWEMTWTSWWPMPATGWPTTSPAGW